MLRVDDLLALLPEAGMDLIYLGQHAGADPWGCMIRPSSEDSNSRTTRRADGQGATPVAALVDAFHKAGFNVTDE